MTVLSLMGCILAFLAYTACVDIRGVEDGMRLWIARTLVEAGMAATLGGLGGMLLGYCLVVEPDGFRQVLRWQSRGRRRRRVSFVKKVKEVRQWLVACGRCLLKKNRRRERPADGVKPRLGNAANRERPGYSRM